MDLKLLKQKGGKDEMQLSTKLTENEEKYSMQKGITLIALVVTIVVLLILAGVTINAVFSDSGIIKKAQEAQDKANESVQKDIEQINALENWMNDNIGEKKDPEIEKIKEVILNSGSEELNYNIDMNMDAKNRKTVTSGTENAFQDAYVFERFVTGKTATLTYDMQFQIDFSAVRKKLYKIVQAAKALEDDDLYKAGIKGEFTFEIYYDDNRIQIADKDKYLETGKMTGFNDEMKEIFIDTKRTDEADPEHEGYKKMSITLQLKAPTSTKYQGVDRTETGGNTLLLGDLMADPNNIDILFADATFTIPSCTISEDPFAGTDLYYTTSIDFNGSMVVGMPITINTSTIQKEGCENDYNGVQDWQNISCTAALLKKSSGGAGGGGGN